MSWNGPEIDMWIILKEDFDVPYGGGLASRTGKVRFGMGESKYDAEQASHARFTFSEALNRALQMSAHYEYVGVDMYVPSVLPPGYYAIRYGRFGHIVYPNGSGGSWHWESISI